MRGKMVCAWLAVTLALAAAQGVRAEDAPRQVKVGDWQLETMSFFSGHGDAPAIWSGWATGSLDLRYEVSIGAKTEVPDFGTHAQTRELQVAGRRTIEVTAVAYDAAQMQQQQAPARRSDYAAVTYAFVSFLGEQAVTVRGHMQIHGTPEAALAEFLQGADALPPAELLEAMLARRVVVGTYACAADYPQLTAAIDGAEPQPLKGRPGVRGAKWGWELPARPGQNVVLRLRCQAVRYAVTTWGIERADAPGALGGRPVDVSQGRGPVDRHSWDGRLSEVDDVSVPFGVLCDERMLTVQLEGCFGMHDRLNANVVLRWGRPEERWLQSGSFPFSGLPREPGLDATVRALAADLEAGFDPDTGGWFDQWQGGATRPRAGPEAAAAAGLDGTAFPHLTGADARDMGSDWTDRFGIRSYGRASSSGQDWQVEQAIRGVVAGRAGDKLWEPRTSSTGKKGWHSPQAVCALALAWRDCPDLRDAIPLERTLDFWCESIKTQPLPLGERDMGRIREDDSVDSLAEAVVALHVGAKAFSKPEYAQARDALLARMRECGMVGSLYQSMLSKADPGHPENVRWTLSYDDLVRFAAVYGQTCAFIGNTEELDKVRDWTAAVLSRKGEGGQTLYQRYQYARFSTRCALLAAVRGLSPLFVGPPAPQTEVSATGS